MNILKQVVSYKVINECIGQKLTYLSKEDAEQFNKRALLPKTEFTTGIVPLDKPPIPVEPSKEILNPDVVKITFEPHFYCNYECKHCTVIKGALIKGKVHHWPENTNLQQRAISCLQGESANTILQMGKDFINHVNPKEVKVFLMGGELTLAPILPLTEFIDKVKATFENATELCLTTNGFRDYGYLKELAKHLTHLVFSFHDSKLPTGRAKQALFSKTLHLAVDKSTISSTLTVNRDNQSFLKSFYRASMHYNNSVYTLGMPLLINLTNYDFTEGVVPFSQEAVYNRSVIANSDICNGLYTDVLIGYNDYKDYVWFSPGCQHGNKHIRIDGEDKDIAYRDFLSQFDRQAFNDSLLNHIPVDCNSSCEHRCMPCHTKAIMSFEDAKKLNIKYGTLMEGRIKELL